jgi:hypothetical protein
MRIENWRITVPCVLVLGAGCAIGQAWSDDPAAVNGALYSGGVTPTYETCGNATDGRADDAVIIPSEWKLLSAEPSLYPDLFAFGQQAYFPGFPYGFYTTLGGDRTGRVALINIPMFQRG